MEILSLIVSIIVLLGVIFLFVKLPKDPTTVITEFRSAVETSLKNQEDRIHNSLSLVTNQTGNVGTRLDSAATVIGQLKGQLGELSQATKEIKELGQSVQGLERLLQAPKFRGGFGEMLLEDLIKQVLPADKYSFQHRFKSGHIADALVITAANSVVIDSKFPFENFKKAMQVAPELKKTYVRAFITDVKKHIDAISEKYILPNEGTFSFAICFIPMESLYYELVARDESIDGNNEIIKYAQEKKVILASPTTLYAYLTTIAYGLKGLEVEKNVQVIVGNLEALRVDLSKFFDIWGVLGNHIKNVGQKFAEGDKAITDHKNRLVQITTQV